MKTIRYLLMPLALTGLLTAVVSCSTTRRIPSDEQLYTGLKGINIITDSTRFPSEIRSAITEAVDVEPNNYLSMLHWRYPFPLGLWVYNNWNPESRGIKGWLYDKLVEEPVLVSDVRPEMRTHLIDQMLDNNGYFSGTSSYEIIDQRNPRKAKIAYTIHAGHPYMIDTVQLLPDTCHLNHMIDSLAKLDRYLAAGRPRYSVDSLNVARTRITNSLRNRGYYYFQPDFIQYLADSVQIPGSIALRLDLASNAPAFALQEYRTGNVTFHVARHYGGGSPDTIKMQRATLIQMMPSKLRHKLIDENVTFRRGRTFSVRDMNRTQTYLSRLGIFSAIEIEPKLDTLSRKSHMLDVDIYCTLNAPLEASIEVNATSKSNSYIGPGIIFGVTNNNIFGGGEQLSVQVVGSYEWQTGRGRRSIFNSYEAGVTATLAFPRLLAPKWIPRSRWQLNWTRFSLNADLLNRPHFFKMAQFNAAVTYDWRYRRRVSNTFTPFKLTYTKLMRTTAEFDSIMAENRAIALSFRSQFIPQMIYGYTYDRAIDRDNTINWTFTLQEAGNVFWSIYELCGKHGEKELFGTPFSQFVKGSTQLVYGRRIMPGEHWLMARVAVGAAHAYGNSQEVPYAEQFYIGGANSLRAFTVRSIGPGSYRKPGNTPQDYFDQTGTFKFEANLEYRFPLVGPLHGAIFVDSGNIWLLKNDPQRPGGLLRASTFLRDLAVGTGVGLRFDISMLVIRGDLGIGLHAPYETGRSGWYNMPSFGHSLAFHLAIGYPF